MVNIDIMRYCKDCTERTISCHSTCLKYKLFKIWRDKQAAEIREIKRNESDYVDFLNENFKRRVRGY